MNSTSVVVRSGMSVGKSLLLIQTLLLPINFHIHVFWIKEMGKYAGSMRTRTLSGAGTIHVNGEVLEYLIQGNQHGYCAVHTPQCRTYGTIPYAVCRMKYALREHASSLFTSFCIFFSSRYATFVLLPGFGYKHLYPIDVNSYSTCNIAISLNISYTKYGLRRSKSKVRPIIIPTLEDTIFVAHFFITLVKKKNHGLMGITKKN